MQITELPLNALISIDFNAVDEHGPGTLYSILDVNMLQVDLPEALGVMCLHLYFSHCSPIEFGPDILSMVFLSDTSVRVMYKSEVA